MAKSNLPVKRDRIAPPTRQKKLKPFHRFTMLEKRFVENYFRYGFDLLKAFDASGYSMKATEHSRRANAWKIMRRPHIQAEIERRMEKHQMSANEALARTAAVGRADMGACLVDHEVACPECGHVIEEEGHLRFDLRKAKELGMTHLIKKLTEFKDGRIVIEFYGADTARDTILKAHGAFREKDQGDAGSLLSLLARAREAQQRAKSNGQKEEAIDVEYEDVTDD